MNMNSIINMIIRQVMRRFINGGINKGMDVASKGFAKRGKNAPEGDNSHPDQRS